MNRAMVERHLTQAEEHIALGERHIAHQHELIAELERNGHDTTEARRLLTTFEEMQKTHLEHRDTIRQELAQNS